MLNTFNATRVARFGSGAVILRSQVALEDDQIRMAAPSVFASEKHDSRSERYSYIPTSEVLRGLRAEGFMPFEVRQGGSRDDAKRGFTKHMLRLRHASDIGAAQGENIRELILMNAHDGTSSYRLMSGIFRVVCSNGLIAAAGDAQECRVGHTGNAVEKVIEGAYSIIDNAQAVQASIEDMRAVRLNQDEQDAFASAALALRYDEDKVPEVAASQVHRARRQADVGNDLWRTFNRTQETLVNGGMHYTHFNANNQRSRRETRPVNSIDGNVALNRALWVLAERMAELKLAGAPLVAA